MTVIDAHVHVGPGLANHSPRPHLTAETGAQLIEIMDESGIDVSCAFAPLLEGGDFEDPEFAESNHAVHEVARRYPDRVVGFCRVNPNYGPRALEEMKRCREEYGFRGLKLHPDWEFFYINGRPARAIYERAAEYGWPVVLHTGYYPLSHPTAILPVAKAFPTVDFVLFHLGYRHTADAIIVARECPNVYLETSGNATAQNIAQVLSSLGPSRLIYGSDIPYTTPEDVQQKIRLQPLVAEEDEELIFGGTIRRLLERSGPVPALNGTSRRGA
jgi:uncharacterized protein